MDPDEIPVDLPDEIKQVIQQYEQGMHPDVLKKLEEKHPEKAEVINRLSPCFFQQSWKKLELSSNFYSSYDE